MKKIKDHFYHKAKKDKYPARSVYKLEEIDLKYRIIKKGHKILDLGASPGSWSKYCINKVGREGLVVGVDINDVKLESHENWKFIEQDILNIDIKLLKNISDKFDVVISDLAPKTTGMKFVDQAKSLELVHKAYDISENILKNNGCFICKVFQGNDFIEFQKNIKNNFEWVKVVKPKGSRKESFEVYLVAYGFKRQVR